MVAHPLSRAMTRETLRMLGRVLVAAFAIAHVPVRAATGAPADLEREIQFQIPSQSLENALIAFSTQAGVPVSINSRLVEGIEAPPLNGRLRASTALTQLLTPSGLSFSIIGNTVTVVRATSVPRDGSAQARNPYSARLAQVDDAVPAASDAGRSAELQRSLSARDKPVQLDEVVVSAQKREQRAFDVPISMVVLGADELQRRKVAGIDDLAFSVPGLSIASTGAWGRQIMLRGVSNSFGNSSLIGLYVDEASVTASPSYAQPDVRTYDLERVEVLRGPQGTLYGEGSVGGTIRFITKSPDLERAGASANASASITEAGGPGQKIEGVVNVPLIEDELGLRVAGTYDHGGGWIDQPGVRENWNTQNLLNMRVKGLWQPTSKYRLDVMAIVHRNDAPPNVGEDAAGDYTQVFGLATTPDAKQDYDLYSVTQSYDFSAARLLSATSYIDQDKQIANWGRTLQTNPPGSLQPNLLQLLNTQSFNILTEELRLTSLGAGPWQWTIGSFYRHAKDELAATNSYGLPGQSFTYSYSTKNLSESWALFANTSYDVTDRLTLGAGLRYFEDDQEDRVGIQRAKFHTANPRVYAQLKISEHANVYGSAAKGFRSGGFNGAPTLPTYDPESVWTYELGTKWAAADGRLNTDLAVFYSDYIDYQIVGIQPDNFEAGSITSNAGDARIKGLEWTVGWMPAQGWSLALSGDYIESEFYRIEVTNTSYATGDPLDLVPKYGYTLAVQRDLSWNGREGFARVDYSQRGRSTYRNRSVGSGTPYYEQFGHWYFNESDIVKILNVSLHFQLSEHTSFGVFGQNLLNDRGYLDPYSIETNSARSRPRSYGVDVGVTF